MFDQLQRAARLKFGTSETGLPTDGGRPRSLVYEGSKAALQQSFRFLLKIRGIDVAYISDVVRPAYRIETEEHKLLNWSFNYPVDLKWEPIRFTIREIFDRDVMNSVGGFFYDKLRELSYDTPDDINRLMLKDLSKFTLTDGTGPIEIQMLDPEGEVYEKWKLFGAFINEVKFSDLNYGSDELTNISVGVIYDFAKLQFMGNVMGKPDFNTHVANSLSNFKKQYQTINDTKPR